MCDQCVEWGGKKWHRYNGGHYTTMVRLHREIWESTNGPIPEGFHVHHVNRNKGDNRLENLELLTHSEHSAEHGNEKLALHRAVALKNAFKARLRYSAIRHKRKLKCVVCSCIYHSGAKTPSRFCSMACIDISRSGAFGGERRVCEFCATPYEAKKRVQRFCSRECNAMACQQRQSTEKQVACAKCSVTFTSKRINARFCSRPCALAFHGDNRFRGKVGRAD
jgi:hypothetical protein